MPGMEMFQPMTELEATATWNVLVYGATGAGKTTFASTAPGPVAYLAVEPGLKSVKPSKDIHVAKINTLDDLQQAYSFLLSEQHPFRSVVLDSLSEAFYGPIASYALHHSRRAQNEDPDILGRRDYLRTSEVLRDLVRAFRDLPLNTIVVAGERQTEDDGRMIRALHLAGDPRTSVPYQFDVVGYMYQAASGNVEEHQDSRYFMRIKGHQNLVSKIRIPKEWMVYLPTEIENPTWDRLIQAIENARSEAEKTQPA